MRVLRTSARIAGSVLIAALAACSNPAATDRYPTEIQSCEWNTGTVCGSWTLQNGEYSVSWTDDVTSTVKVVRFTETAVEFQRTDLTKNADFTARYVGTVTGRTAAGTVTWTQHGSSWSGTWSAEW